MKTPLNYIDTQINYETLIAWWDNGKRLEEQLEDFTKGSFIYYRDLLLYISRSRKYFSLYGISILDTIYSIDNDEEICDYSDSLPNNYCNIIIITKLPGSSLCIDVTNIDNPYFVKNDWFFLHYKEKYLTKEFKKIGNILKFGGITL